MHRSSGDRDHWLPNSLLSAQRRRISAPILISGLLDEHDMDIAIDPLALETSCHLSDVFAALR